MQLQFTIIIIVLLVGMDKLRIYNIISTQLDEKKNDLYSPAKNLIRFEIHIIYR